MKRPILVGFSWGGGLALSIPAMSVTTSAEVRRAPAIKICRNIWARVPSRWRIPGSAFVRSVINGPDPSGIQAPARVRATYILAALTLTERGSIMTNIACELEHSVEAEVSSSFAWNLRTDIKTWDDPPARFHLDGPFASGSWGTTLLPGREPVRWQIRDVRPGAAFIIEVPLDGATLSFEWLFDALSNHRSRMTQRIVLWGPNADAYVSEVQAGFGSTLADGMKRIADSLERADRSTTRRRWQ